MCGQYHIIHKTLLEKMLTCPYRYFQWSLGMTRILLSILSITVVVYKKCTYIKNNIETVRHKERKEGSKRSDEAERMKIITMQPLCNNDVKHIIGGLFCGWFYCVDEECMSQHT